MMAFNLGWVCGVSVFLMAGLVMEGCAPPEKEIKSKLKQEIELIFQKGVNCTAEVPDDPAQDIVVFRGMKFPVKIYDCALIEK